MRVYVALIGVCAVAAMSYSNHYEEVAIETEGVFVPKGFDSNDHVEIVVTGQLPNTCYLRPRGEIEITGNKINIRMMATKISGDDVNCIMAIVPYLVSVPLGKMTEGNYDIQINEGATSETKSAIVVEQPNSNSINNFSYANVTHVTILTREQKIVLEGFHPSSCMEIDRVEIVSNESHDTYSILPILKQIGQACDQTINPFSIELVLPKEKGNDRVVLHVRKMDGTGLNYLWDHRFRSLKSI
jgi:sulfur carrier protein ThiS